VRSGGVASGGTECPLSRPAWATPRPFVQDTQTAVVVGPPGEEIFTDKYGRVKVQFHWDRQGQLNEKELQPKISNSDKLELYDYPGEYAQRFVGVDASGDRPAGVQKISTVNKRTIDPAGRGCRRDRPASWRCHATGPASRANVLRV
jgi:hypothetical protein